MLQRLNSCLFTKIYSVLKDQKIGRMLQHSNLAPSSGEDLSDHNNYATVMMLLLYGPQNNLVQQGRRLSKSMVTFIVLQLLHAIN